MFRIIIVACKGIIRSQYVRRTVMFWNVLTVVWMFLGATFFWPWLREHPLAFLGYWAFGGWLTMLAALLAVYDMAKVALDARQTRERLERDILERDAADSSHDSHSH